MPFPLFCCFSTEPIAPNPPRFASSSTRTSPEDANNPRLLSNGARLTQPCVVETMPPAAPFVVTTLGELDSAETRQKQLNSATPIVSVVEDNPSDVSIVSSIDSPISPAVDNAEELGVLPPLPTLPSSYLVSAINLPHGTKTLGEFIQQHNQQLNSWRFFYKFCQHVLQSLLIQIEAYQSRNLVHRNITLNNVCITPDGEVRIIGIDSEHRLQNSIGSKEFGSTPYRDPKADKDNGKYSDYWSLGLIAYVLFTGDLNMVEPRQDKSKTIEKHKMIAHALLAFLKKPSALDSHQKDVAANLIIKLLEVNTASRFGSRKLRRQSELFSKCGLYDPKISASKCQDFSNEFKRQFTH